MNPFLFFTTLCLMLGSCELIEAHNKYSKEANEDLLKLQKPFRMQKLNLLWEKATMKLDASKLKQLHSDLKNQDKDEQALKKLKADNQDKDGFKEEEIRRQLRRIVKKYGLDYEENLTNKQYPKIEELSENTFFKDVKLDKLWKKAQKADFTEPQLKILKEELRQYEDKMSQYHQLIDAFNHKAAKEHQRKEDSENHIDYENANSDFNIVEANDRIKEKHIELKEDFKRLSDMVYKSSTGENLNDEFEEERAAALWKIALSLNFTDTELEGLRDELLHFQNRIKKLKFFQGQLENDRLAGKNINEHIEYQSESQKHITKRVKELDDNVNTLHKKIETKILKKHSEL